MSSSRSRSARSSSSSRSTGASGAARPSRASSRRSSTCSRSASGSASSSTARRTSRTTSRSSTSSRPGLLAATAMQLATFESSWPVLAAIKWDRQYHAMLATPLRVRDVVLGQQAFVGARLLGTSAIYLAVIAAFGAVNSLDGSPRDPRRRARRARVLEPDRGLGRAHRDRGLVRRDLPLRDPADVPLLGDVLPDRGAADGARGDRVPDAALARRRALPDAHARRRRGCCRRSAISRSCSR